MYGHFTQLFSFAVPGCKLSKDNPEKVWAPAKKEDEEEDDDDEDFVQETLFLKHVSTNAL